MATRPDIPRGERGFTYLGLLFLIAVMGLLASVAASTWTFVSQRDKELDLLFAGQAYQTAIARYAAAHVRQPQPFPTDLAQLLGTRDSLVPVRYLRRLYFDPMTGGTQWGLVRTPRGGIVGVYSLSERVPVRTRAIAGDIGIDFARARTYRDWVFNALALPLAPRQGGVPGWNYAQDGEPPPTWENTPPAAPVEAVSPD